ncbi:hypothetical protein L1987_83895 [Smallanthus sonchifolius]|uniref:Uncharacterized protein n=1 Tax=Smallanthus sonchifolius TaxID=185202 RepID=A0ACB8YDV8_9ASTR|nr:hypothetical protein L1987_83895 [Smallanthus sonchifolius]
MLPASSGGFNIPSDFTHTSGGHGRRASFSSGGIRRKERWNCPRAANVSFVCCLWQNPRGKVDYWNYCFVDCIRFR